MSNDKRCIIHKAINRRLYAFLILTKLEYPAGLIKEESTSELLRFTIRHILNQACNQPEYQILKQQQEKQSQNNQ
jgi:hypothetical protein